jgi:hypothetical protein
MSARAKFKCTAKGPGEQGNVSLEAVMNGSEENQSFYKYTPSGVINMGILNPPAFSQFEVGKEYYVDFSEAE